MPFGSAAGQDVARLAGALQSAVSRCFMSNAAISDKTRAMVVAAAALLHYSPNAMARSLTTRRSNVIGALIRPNNRQPRAGIKRRRGFRHGP
jgi:DNA-binding LacI/PurR family transcriptional regulator